MSALSRTRIVVIGMGVACLVLVAALLQYRAQVASWTLSTFGWGGVAYLLDSDDPNFLVQLGMYYFEGVHDLDKAKEMFEHAIRAQDDAFLAHYQLARVYFIRGDFFNALVEINNELSVNPQNAHAFYMRGLISGYRDYPGDLEKAESDFVTFIEERPFIWAGYNDLAWIQIRRERFTEAKETVERAFDELPSEVGRNVWLWNTLGSAELNLKDYEAARQAFENAKQISDQMTAEYFWSAYPGNDGRNAEEAFHQFRATLFFNLGVVYEKTEKTEKAIEYYSKYLDILPSGPYPTREEVEAKIEQLKSRP